MKRGQIVAAVAIVLLGIAGFAIYSVHEFRALEAQRMELYRALLHQQGEAVTVMVNESHCRTEYYLKGGLGLREAEARAEFLYRERRQKAAAAVDRVQRNLDQFDVMHPKIKKQLHWLGTE